LPRMVAVWALADKDVRINKLTSRKGLNTRISGF
jgi:hypothetical protein